MRAMVERCPLGVYVYEELLVIYWRRSDKLSQEINITVNHKHLERPLLGVEFEDNPEYLLALRSHELRFDNPFTVRVSTLDAEVLAEAYCQKALPLPFNFVARWPLANRARVERALIGQLNNVFPMLDGSVRVSIAKSLAEKQAIVIKGPNNQIYCRLPWITVDEPSLLDGGIHLLRDDREIKAESVKVLLDHGWAHFFCQKAGTITNQNDIWLLDVVRFRCIPFIVQHVDVENDSTLSLSQWIDKIVKSYKGSQEVLKGYSKMVLQPVGLIDTNQHLMGEVEGIRDGKLVGWAFDGMRPNSIVRLAAVIDGIKEEEFDAQLPRSDFKSKGYGNCGFIWKPDPKWMNGELHQIEICCAETGEQLEGSPLWIGRGKYDGDFRLDDEGNVIGWVSERCSISNQVLARILIDKKNYREVVADLVVRGGSKETEGGWNNRKGFYVPLPNSVFDTDEHLIEVEVFNDNKPPYLLNRSIRVKANYRGHIETYGPDRVTGWIFNTIAPERVVFLEIKANGLTVAHGKANLPSPNLPDEKNAGKVKKRQCGFDIAIPVISNNIASLTLDICLEGTDFNVFSESVLHTPYDIAIRSLTTLAETLNDKKRWEHLAGGLVVSEDVTSWLRYQIIPQLLLEIRKAKSIPDKINLPLSPEVRLPRRVRRESIIDVIVPVYMGRDDVMRCLASVLTAPNDVVTKELVVINDASPDPEFNAELRRMSLNYGFLLLENKSNLGFVGTVNRGMRLHPGRDVVLLNSDTVVSDNWLDRIYSAAYSAKNIGTVTPFSNNATICSFPEFCQDNALPTAMSAKELDAYFAECNRGETIDIPTAVGFCMYIKRDVLEETGYFDEGLWGRGYGEENDFCLKSSALGWRHVVACDTFVEHKGGVSFGDKKKQQLSVNLAKLSSIYPDYANTIQRFILQDPLVVARNRVVKALFRKNSDRYILFLIHNLGGGTQVAVDQLANRLSLEDTATIQLKPLSQDYWRLEVMGKSYALYYKYPQDFDLLIQDLRDLGVWHVHFHHILNFPWIILTLPNILGVSYDFTMHDYLSLCPRINMIDESGEYCNEAQFSAEVCTRCTKINGVHPGIDKLFDEASRSVGIWRSKFSEWLHKARKVYAPSRDVASRLNRHFNGLSLFIEPHIEDCLEKQWNVLRNNGSNTVALIGAIGIHKGYDILVRCARNAEKEALPLRFVVIGYTCDDANLVKYENVEVIGEYNRDDLPELIAKSGATVALFLSPWPETYSYTLTEAWRNGLYPVAFDIGAIAERIKETKCGRLMPITSDPKTINRVLLEVLAEDHSASMFRSTAKVISNVISDYYGFNKAGDLTRRCVSC